MSENNKPMKELNELIDQWTEKYFGKDKGLFIEMTLTAIALDKNANIVDSALSFSKHMTIDQVELHTKTLLEYAKEVLEYHENNS